MSSLYPKYPAWVPSSHDPSHWGTAWMKDTSTKSSYWISSSMTSSSASLRMPMLLSNTSTKSSNSQQCNTGRCSCYYYFLVLQMWSSLLLGTVSGECSSVYSPHWTGYIWIASVNSFKKSNIKDSVVLVKMVWYFCKIIFTFK